MREGRRSILFASPQPVRFTDPTGFLNQSMALSDSQGVRRVEAPAFETARKS